MGFNIGPLHIRFYGIILMSGALAGAFLAARLAKQRKLNPEIIWDMFTWILIGGVIGARIWHILTPPPSMVARGITTKYYLTHPLDALAIWEGGLGIPGAVIGGLLAVYWFSKKRKLNFLFLTDLCAAPLALGQAIGRWGNYVNQEVYGKPTDLPWAITIDPLHRLPEYMGSATYHPLFLYESLWNLGNMFLLLWLYNKFSDRLKDGDIFLVYMITYPIARFFLDFLRLDASEIAGINANQSFMVLVILFAAGVFVYRRIRDKRKVAD